MPSLATFATSKTALKVLVSAVTAALVVGVLSAFAFRGDKMTLTLDGRATEIRSTGDTVADVLADQGIQVTKHDLVAPSLDAPVHDGSRIAVRFGRPLDLQVDGKESRHWVTATDVASALDQIGVRLAGSDLSVSRSASISRDGMNLRVITPKRLTFRVAGARPVKDVVTALTVAQALKERHVKVDKDDIVSPGLGRIVHPGDRITVTKVRVVERRDRNEALSYGTDTVQDSSMTEGDQKVVRAGRAGHRDVTYRLRFENGHLVARKVVKVRDYVAPVDQVVHVGTKPKPAPVVAYASGSTVWDSLAQCESGGNWAANTGNGYYGGLQFNLGTWQSYGGSGLPSQNSRETQIAIATKVRDASGGYGAWPACAASLGLPR